MNLKLIRTFFINHLTIITRKTTTCNSFDIIYVVLLYHHCCPLKMQIWLDASSITASPSGPRQAPHRGQRAPQACPSCPLLPARHALSAAHLSLFLQQPPWPLLRSARLLLLLCLHGPCPALPLPAPPQPPGLGSRVTPALRETPAPCFALALDNVLASRNPPLARASLLRLTGGNQSSDCFSPSSSLEPNSVLGRK